MKNFTVLISAFLIFTSISNAQIVGQKPAKNVPIAVSEAFINKFGKQNPVWFENYQGRYDQKLVYEGRFRFDNRYSAAMYDKNGIMVAFAAHVEPAEIPADALVYMRENFPTFPIMDALLVTAVKEGVTYELGIIVDGEYIVKVFSEKGKFIKSTRA